MPPSDSTNIAVIQTAFLGDVALALTLVQDLRNHLPHARIIVVTTPAAASLVRCAEACDEVIVFDKRGRDAGVRGILRLAAQLRAHGIDTVFGVQRSMRTSLLALLSGARSRIGFREATASFLYTRTISWKRGVHETQRNHELLQSLRPDIPGHPVSPADVVLHTESSGLPSSLHHWERATEQRRHVILAPGSVWKTKRWPRERWTEVARHLRDQGAEVIVVGGRDDAVLCETIAADAGVIAVCDASLPQVVNIMRRADVVITNDSAPTHLAGLAGVRTVTIYGSTLPSFGFAPQGAGDAVVEDASVECRPCGLHGRRECPLGTLQCLHAITAEKVLQVVEAYPSA